MDVNNIIALNAKALREQRRLTLDAAAEATGVSRSMLAQIEKGDVNPTISVLWKIANGYKVSFTALMEQPQEASVAVLHSGEPLAEDGGRYLNYPAFAFDEAKGFETYRIVIKEGGSLQAQAHLKGAEEYITVFSGSVKITVGSEAYSLNAGDSIRFKADVPHAYANTSVGEAQLAMLIYYNR